MLKTHKQIATLFASLALGLAAVPMTASAGTEVATGKDGKAAPPVETPVTSYITGDLGVAFVSSYYSRGILQGPEGAKGFDAQPYLDLYFKLYEGQGVLNKVTLNLGLWSNLASDTRSTRGSSNSTWTEFDWMPGLSFVFAKNFTLTLSYFELDYPGESGFNTFSKIGVANVGNFSPQRAININLAYDDTDLLGMWALHPHITFLQEITGADSAGGHVGLGIPDHNGKFQLGQYDEIGIAPSFTFLKSSKYPLTLTLPVTAGFGSSGFYGTGFGYASAGANLSVPLAFIPAGFGTWTASAGGTYYYLGTDTSRVNAAGNFSNGRADHDAGVASVSIGLTF